jgi:hydrophobic/amphiphilic exporter-1 (mainly G- bacteria), HAE1 family
MTIESLIRKPVALSMAYIALLAGGVFALWRLPLDLAPNVEYPALSIQTAWPGVSAETVEMLVTAPIEETTNTVAGVRKVSSVSSEGESRVDIECEQNARMDFLRLELNEKLAALVQSLPAGVGQPAIEPFVPEDFRDMQGFISYAIVGDRTPAALRMLGREILGPRLRSIKGVADVQVLGGEDREVLIELDRETIASLGLRTESVASVLGALEFNAPLGAVTHDARRMVISVRTAGLTTDAIALMPVGRTSSGMPVLLRDCGTVRLTAAEPQSHFRINGKPAVTLVISKEPYVNTIRLAGRVFARIGELRTTLPEGVDLVLESDKSASMRTELSTLYRDVIFSLLCIVLVLILFFGTVRAPLLVLSSIAFSLAGTFLAFWILGIGLHLLSLAGLVLGFGRLVDDSIVVLDNIQRRNDGTPFRDAIPRAVREIALPVVASTITTVGALLPTSFLPPNLKPYFLDFSLAVGIALLMSLAVSFTLIPVAAARMRLEPVLPALYARIGSRGSAAYAWTLRAVTGHRRITILLALWLFGLPVWVLPEQLDGTGVHIATYNAVFGSPWYRSARPWVNHLLGGSSYLFFAKVSKGEIWTYGKETYLVVRVVFPQGTDLQRSDEIARRVESTVLAFGDRVQKVTTRVSNGSTIIRITVPDSLAATSAPYLIKNNLTMLAARTGGATIGVWGFGPGFSSGGESAPSFAVRVLGYNYLKVKEIADVFRRRLEENPRIADVDIDRSWSSQWGKSTELVARVDRQEAARYGVGVADVINAVRASTPGVLQSNRVTVDGERVPYSVKVAGFREYSVDDLRRAMVTGQNGQAVRMAALLAVKEQRTPGEILREDQSYVRWVTFEYRGPYRFGEAYVDAVIRSIPLPHGYRFDRSFSWFTFSETDRRMMLMIAGVAFLIVFMVTAALYESFRRPFLVILAIPFSLIGLFLAFYLTDTPFGRGGYAAVILLIGIVTTNSIVLVDVISRACPGRSVPVDALIAAATSRLRPVLMTTLTTIGGLLPMLLLGDRSSVWYSLALGTIGGLLSSTILTLVVVPARAIQISEF